MPHLQPWGSHPLLDNYYTSGHFQTEHHGIEMSRIKKTQLIAEWPVGLQNIQVCTGQNSENTNCGACEKCIRTMTALVALGKLKGCQSFPLNDVSADIINTVDEYNMIYADNQAYYYKEMIPYLEEQKRYDLVAAINKVCNSYEKKKTGKSK